MDQVARANDVFYVGHVPHQDALALMRGAEIVIMPSRSEGLSRVILEAVSLGVKVICPPDIPEFEQHLPAFVLPEVSASAIAAALEKVWADNTRPSYPLSDHTIARVVTQLLETYRDTLKAFRAP
jgi:glycosyltransferase involved in cell wall biosynthesis